MDELLKLDGVFTKEIQLCITILFKRFLTQMLIPGSCNKRIFDIYLLFFFSLCIFQFNNKFDLIFIFSNASAQITQKIKKMPASFNLHFAKINDGHA